jgi:hypothetical protein
MLHRYRIQPSSLARLRFTGNLAAPARNLAKSLDKVLGVEYLAPVLIDSLHSSLCFHSHAASLTANHRLTPCSHDVLLNRV